MEEVTIKTLNIDIETYSSYDLKKVGVYKYVEAPDFDILIFAYSVDDGPTQTVELALGEKIPSRILEALLDGKVLKKAFNAQFERVALSEYLRNQYYEIASYHESFTSLGYLNPKQWRCTMVDAMKAGLPGSLEQAAKVLKLDEQKDTAGTALINYFSKPCKPTKANGQRTRNLPEHDMEKWRAFVEYCRQDVETEKAIGKAVVPYLNIGSKSDRLEQMLYALDQEINDRGILLDMKLVEGALAIDEAYKDKLMKLGQQITGLDNPNSPKQLLEWFQEQGLELPNLTKDTVKKALKKADGSIKTMLEIRQELSKTSTAKYVAMKNAVCRDGRVRGLLQFYGASRTGRWAGRLVQVQNLPRNKINDLELARDLVKDVNLEGLEMLYDKVPFVLSELIRTAFVASDGKTFAISDFSAIEARVIAWLADEVWRIKVFETHGKIYEASASQMFGVPIEQIHKGSPLRDKGKIAELALGYQGGVNAMISMGALEMGLNEEELPGIVEAWRESNQNIVRLWWDAERAAMNAINNPSDIIQFRKGILMRMWHGALIIQLPSGRWLIYQDAKIRDHQKFEGKKEIIFKGIDGTSKKFTTQATYGGKLVENMVQAIARDCLAYALLRLDKENYELVMHVHDEAVMESKPDTICTIEEIMGRSISWGKGLPLEADGFESKFYKKD